MVHFPLPCLITRGYQFPSHHWSLLTMVNVVNPNGCDWGRKIERMVAGSYVPLCGLNPPRSVPNFSLHSPWSLRINHCRDFRNQESKVGTVGKNFANILRVSTVQTIGILSDYEHTKDLRASTYLFILFALHQTWLPTIHYSRRTLYDRVMH